MARNESNTTQTETVVTEAQMPLTEQRDFANSLVAMNQSAQRLAVELGYEGGMSVGALEDDVRHFMGRAADAFLDMGKRLLILKEMTPHGEFKKRIELLGIEYRVAVRSMSVALKYSKVPTLALLKAAGSQSKILELGMLDDSELEELNNGETVRGINLDKIETMSYRELKKALRESNATLEASRNLVAKKDQKINELEVELDVKKQSPDATDIDGEELRGAATGVSYSIEVMLRGELKNQFEALTAHGERNGVTHSNFMAGLVCQLEYTLNQLRGTFDIPTAPSGEEVPDWLRDEVAE